MTKLLAFGDLHLGAGTDFGTPERPRLDDLAYMLEQIEEAACKERVDAVLFAGDMSHTRKPSPAEIDTYQQMLLQPLDEAMIPSHHINGNHDVTTRDQVSSLYVATAGFKYATTHAAPGIVSVRDIDICMLPWTPTHSIASDQDLWAPDEAVADASEALMKIARAMHTASLEDNPDGRRILLGHWSATGATTPTGASVDEFREPKLDTDVLADMGWDAVVLGHIHKGGFLRHGPPTPVLYTGSLAVKDWGEIAVMHGYWILDFEENGDHQVSFHPMPDRPFLEVEYDVASGIMAADRDFDGAVCRVRYEATPEQERHIDHGAIRAELERRGASKVTVTAALIRPDGTRMEVTEQADIDMAFVRWVDAQGEPLLEHRGRLLEWHDAIRKAVG